MEKNMRDVQDFGEQGGVVPVIDVAATSTFLDPIDMERTFKGELQGCYLYSRHSNPTVTAFGRKMAALEGMEAALGVASGMAAIASSIEQLMPDGGHLICSRVVYGGTYALFKNLLPKLGITISWFNPERPEEIEPLVTKETKLIYTETMSNPMLGVSDLARIGAIAKKHRLELVVDNTFCPTLIQPARFGATVVVYSCTKYISGSSDMIAGAIVGSQKLIESLVDINTGVVMLKGPVMDARIAHELYLRLDHLEVRMRAHSDVALSLATQMEAKGLKVIYPGLPGHKQNALLKKMLLPRAGYGGMITLDCGSRERALKLAAALQDEKFGLYAVSLGFSRTLLSVPSISTSSEIPEDEQKAIGLTDSLLRMSIGLAGDPALLSERFFRCYSRVCG